MTDPQSTSTPPQGTGMQGAPSREDLHQIVDQRIAQLLGLKPEHLKAYESQGPSVGTPFSTIVCGSVTTVVVHC